MAVGKINDCFAWFGYHGEFAEISPIVFAVFLSDNIRSV